MRTGRGTCVKLVSVEMEEETTVRGKKKKERMALTERRMTNERKSDRERTVLRHAWFFFPGVVLFGHVQSDLLGSP